MQSDLKKYTQIYQQIYMPIYIRIYIIDYTKFYFAEDYHQQYLYKNPLGYCGLGGTSVRYRKWKLKLNLDQTWYIIY